MAKGQTELAPFLDFLRSGNNLVVTQPGDHGRDTQGVLNLIQGASRKVSFVMELE